MMACQAKQYSDQMQCAACGLAWDVNDPEPPECLTCGEKARLRAERARDKARREIDEVLKP